MKIDEVFLRRLERLARLELKKEERLILSEELERMVDSFQRLKHVDTGSCKLMISLFMNKNNFRDDTAIDLSDYREIQELVPEEKEGQIVVSEKDREKQS